MHPVGSMDKVHHLNSRIITLTATVASLQTANGQSQQTIERLGRELQAARTQISELKHELQESEDLMYAGSRTCEKLSNEIARVRGENAKLQDELAEAKRQASAALHEKSQNENLLASTVMHLHTKLQDAEKTEALLSNSIASLQSQPSAQLQQAQALFEKCCVLEGENTRLKDVIHRYEATAQELQTRLSVLSSDHLKLEFEYKTVQKQRELLAVNLRELQSRALHLMTKASVLELEAQSKQLQMQADSATEISVTQDGRRPLSAASEGVFGALSLHPDEPSTDLPPRAGSTISAPRGASQPLPAYEEENKRLQAIVEDLSAKVSQLSECSAQAQKALAESTRLREELREKDLLISELRSQSPVSVQHNAPVITTIIPTDPTEDLHVLNEKYVIEITNLKRTLREKENEEILLRQRSDQLASDLSELQSRMMSHPSQTSDHLVEKIETLSADNATLRAALAKLEEEQVSLAADRVRLKRRVNELVAYSKKIRAILQSVHGKLMYAGSKGYLYREEIDALVMEISGAFMDKVSLQEATLTASEANTPTLSGVSQRRGSIVNANQSPPRIPPRSEKSRKPSASEREDCGPSITDSLAEPMILQPVVPRSLGRSTGPRKRESEEESRVTPRPGNSLAESSYKRITSSVEKRAHTSYVRRPNEFEEYYGKSGPIEPLGSASGRRFESPALRSASSFSALPDRNSSKASNTTLGSVSLFLAQKTESPVCIQQHPPKQKTPERSMSSNDLATSIGRRKPLISVESPDLELQCEDPKKAVVEVHDPVHDVQLEEPDQRISENYLQDVDDDGYVSRVDSYTGPTNESMELEDFNDENVTEGSTIIPDSTNSGELDISLAHAISVASNPSYAVQNATLGSYFEEEPHVDEHMQNITANRTPESLAHHRQQAREAGELVGSLTLSRFEGGTPVRPTNATTLAAETMIDKDINQSSVSMAHVSLEQSLTESGLARPQISVPDDSSDTFDFGKLGVQGLLVPEQAKTSPLRKRAVARQSLAQESEHGAFTNQSISQQPAIASGSLCSANDINRLSPPRASPSSFAQRPPPSGRIANGSSHDLPNPVSYERSAPMTDVDLNYYSDSYSVQGQGLGEPHPSSQQRSLQPSGRKIIPPDDTLNEFIDSPEITIKPSTAPRLDDMQDLDPDSHYLLEEKSVHQKTPTTRKLEAWEMDFVDEKKPAGRVEGGMADSTLDYLANMSGAEMDFYDSKQFEGGASLERSAQGGAMGEGLASRSLSIGVGNAVNEPLSTFNELDIDL
ncbi:hypothetical protein GL50803_00113480 [Giardia duodenalis]|uniref:Uncharacterized protein n=2 Tax=Giardia intestinalis TaxID=5741 RepID=A8BX38_GIAIC|nr:hypothetical protein GL50803_00113480 [Giardia intestinalis]KAE8303258.1 hypothetical protein GL50803_00113480 [Giardia intestinalis]|eukprot:XP_001704364.1 Hypothetical protein GL50803_113480 [Giardia lamblia ATCC 50803]